MGKLSQTFNVFGCRYREKSLIGGKGGAQYMGDEDEFEFPKLIPIRASTAPPRPLTEIEEYR